MDGQWPQQNSDVHTELDLTIANLGDDLDGVLGLGPNTSMGNTGDNSAAAAADQDDDDDNQRKEELRRKREKRLQIQQLEAAFKENPHPDERQRRDFSRRLGMPELKVKFWFQNRRSAKKNQEQKRQLKQLQEVNEALEAESQALRSAAEDDTCLTCVADEAREHLLAENARLMEQLEHVNALLEKFTGGTPEVPPIAMPSGSHYPATDPNVGAGTALATDHALLPANEGLVRSQRDTDTMLIDIAGRALQEFCTVVGVGMPMWLPTPDGDGDVLNFQQYAEAMFPSIFGPYWAGSVVDGTRKTGDVLSAADNLVAILMDAARWSEMFPGIVASAAAGRTIPPSASQHGMVLLMDAELRVLTAGVSVRKVRFVRQCQEVQPGKWAVVDVSVDGILGQDGGGVPSTCRLLPSGCLIEAQNSCCCKVTWMVNMEYNENTVSPLYHPLIRSGQALGACRWLGSLQRKCEYLAILHCHPAPALGDTDISPSGRKNIFEVAQQMTRSFYDAMCGPTAQPWRSVDGWRGGCGAGSERFEVDAKVVTFFAGSGEPAGPVVLRATATVWLPGMPAQPVFDYLHDGYRRGEWDSLANGAPIIEEGNFATGQLPRNAVSVLRTIASDGTNGKLILQEARTDASCMVLAYASLDDQSMQLAMSNGGLATLFLLPCGLVILPDGNSESLAPPTSAASSSSTAVTYRSNTGSFVSVMYQTLLGGQPPVKPSLEAIDNAGNQLCRVIRKIKCAVHANSVLIA